MGLKLIPERDTIEIKKVGAVDSWGLPSESATSLFVKGNVKGSEDSTPITSEGGKQIIPTYSVSFNFNPDIKIGDFIIIYGQEYQILTKKVTRDLMGNVVYTKVSI